MTTATNTRSGFRAVAYSGRVVTHAITASTVSDWAESLSIMSDAAFMADIEQGLRELEHGERLYTFEEIFGESPTEAAEDDSKD